MKGYLADLHIHTILSPCGGDEMTPMNIVEAAALKKLDIIGIADHNSTLQAKAVRKAAEKYNLFVLCGAETSTREDIHCLTFFGNDNDLDQYQRFLDENMVKVKNKPKYMGPQLLLDSEDKLIDEIDYYLGASVNTGISELIEVVHSMNGIIIPSHVTRPRNSLLSQLGYIPNPFPVDGLEIDRKNNDPLFLEKNPEAKKHTIIRNSDAHYLEMIGLSISRFIVQKPCFEEICMALKKDCGRSLQIDF